MNRTTWLTACLDNVKLQHVVFLGKNVLGLWCYPIRLDWLVKQAFRSKHGVGSSVNHLCIWSISASLSFEWEKDRTIRLTSKDWNDSVDVFISVEKLPCRFILTKKNIHMVCLAAWCTTVTVFGIHCKSVFVHHTC